jgi:hypothetical protein
MPWERQTIQFIYHLLGFFGTMVPEFEHQEQLYPGTPSLKFIT